MGVSLHELLFHKVRGDFRRVCKKSVISINGPRPVQHSNKDTVECSLKAENLVCEIFIKLGYSSNLGHDLMKINLM